MQLTDLLKTMTKIFKTIFPMLFMLFIIAIFHCTKCSLLKYYPVIVNFGFFLLFFASSFMKETVIQRLAKLMEPNIKPKALDYTRKLTYAWAIFTFLNFIISLYTVFLDEKIWAVYNGCVSYILVGSFFAIEYIVRINFKRKYDC